MMTYGYDPSERAREVTKLAEAYTRYCDRFDAACVGHPEGMPRDGRDLYRMQRNAAEEKKHILRANPWLTKAELLHSIRMINKRGKR
jgi:hypothetical protein